MGIKGIFWITEFTARRDSNPLIQKIGSASGWKASMPAMGNCQTVEGFQLDEACL